MKLKHGMYIVVLMLAVILIASLLVDFRLPQVQPEQTFDSELPKLNQLNSSASLANEPLHQSTTELFTKSSTQLANLKSSLANYNTQTQNAQTKKLAQIYIKLIDYTVLYNNIKSINNSIDIENEFCDNLPKFKESMEKYEILSNMQNTLSQDIQEFVDEYPAEAERIELQSYDAKTMADFYVKENREILQLVQGECQ